MWSTQQQRVEPAMIERRSIARTTDLEERESVLQFESARLRRSEHHERWR